jgi:hypothetical protein
VRAVVEPGYERYISVSGYGSMPIMANAPSPPSSTCCGCSRALPVSPSPSSSSTRPTSPAPREGA